MDRLDFLPPKLCGRNTWSPESCKKNWFREIGQLLLYSVFVFLEKLWLLNASWGNLIRFTLQWLWFCGFSFTVFRHYDLTDKFGFRIMFVLITLIMDCYYLAINKYALPVLSRQKSLARIPLKSSTLKTKYSNIRFHTSSFSVLLKSPWTITIIKTLYKNQGRFFLICI